MWIYVYCIYIYNYFIYFEWRQCPTPTVFAPKAKINSSDINGYRTTSAMFDFRTYGNSSYILLQNRKFTDIGRRSLSAVGQYRTGKQDKWKRPLRRQQILNLNWIVRVLQSHPKSSVWQNENIIIILCEIYNFNIVVRDSH